MSLYSLRGGFSQAPLRRGGIIAGGGESTLRSELLPSFSISPSVSLSCQTWEGHSWIALWEADLLAHFVLC